MGRPRAGTPRFLGEPDRAWCPPYSGGVVALTFDDGPFEGPTAAILAALRQSGVPATFFVVGERAERAPELLAQMLADGHAVAPHCHSESHPSHHDLSAAEIRADLERVLDVIARLGAPPPRFWRPPYGDIRDPETYDVAADVDLTLVTWTVETCDWQDRPADLMLTDLRRPGRPDGPLEHDSVILMHDKPEAAKLVPPLVEELEVRGFGIGPLIPGNPAVAVRGEHRWGRRDGRPPCLEPGWRRPRREGRTQASG